MNDNMSIGEKFVDCDNEELQVLRIGDESMRSPDQELLVVDIDDVTQDIASGDLVRFK